MELSIDVKNKYQLWLDSEFTSTQEKESLKTIMENNPKEINEAFYTDLEFGTGGIRSILGIGPNRMNRHSIRRATQGFANALKKSFSNSISVAIGHDSRNFSKEFAQEAAIVLAANGIKVHLYDHIVATPLLSYAVRYHKAQGGIMVTASHNPREYNGYKVYWDDGCQVTPPYDELIINEYLESSDYSAIPSGDFETFINDGLISYISDDCENSYYDLLLKESLNLDLCLKKGKDLSIVFTPLHGVGGKSIPRALDNLGFSNVTSVPEQIEPDGNFPTVSPPNPEERPALEMAINLMKKINADIAMATDPDADRLGVVVSHQGEFELLNGNQIGILFLDYLASEKKKQNRLGSNPLFIKTIVTTPLQEKIAEYNGVKTINTLTGFKWICGKLKEMETNGESFDLLFATEESYGYLSHTFARDKDAINACTLMAEMTLKYKEDGKTLIDALNAIYEKFGYSNEKLIAKHYLGQEGKEKISKIVDAFRRYDSDTIADLKIEEKIDILAGKKYITGGNTEDISLPKSNVIGLKLEGDQWLWLRPSGTEPKIKFYIMTQSKESSLERSKNTCEQTADKISKVIEEICEKA